MKKRVMLILSCLFLSIGYIAAQSTSYSGVVVDDEGEPVIGASVVVKGTTTGTLTDVDGKFTISVPAEKNVLVFTLVGMETVEQKAAHDMKVVMKENTTELDEVFVVAYGTTPKTSFTGSAATIKSADISRQQVSNVSKALEGAVAGVQISAASGQPGSAANIRVRGIGSISAEKGALIVLDGVPYEGSLTSINNQDVENISVLKDAAATSLYGSRGANGVVLITTKKGKSGRVRVEFENRTGFNTLGLNKYNHLKSPGSFYELYWEAQRNQLYYTGEQDYMNAGIVASDELIHKNLGYNNYNVPDKELINPLTGRLNPNAKLLYHDDWLKEAMRTGLRQENNLSIGGGKDKTTYFVSFNYLQEESYIRDSGLDRLSMRVNLDQEVNKWFKAGVNLSYSYFDQDVIDSGVSAASNIFNMGQTTAPIYPVYAYDANGKRVGKNVYDWGDGKTGMPLRPMSPGSNAIAQQKYNTLNNKYDNISARAYTEIKFMPELKLTMTGSIDNINIDYTRFQTPIGGDALNVEGRGTKRSQRIFVWNMNQILSWNRTFAQDHTFDVMLGHEVKKDRISMLEAEKESYLIPNPDLAGGAKLMDATSLAEEYALEGFFGQIKYEYADRYYFSTSFRRDGSSRFHKDNRWGNFWSVGGSWRVTQEEFLADVKDKWLDDLKFRISYGTQGNDRLNITQAFSNQYDKIEAALDYTLRGNEQLTWEKSNMFNVGLDFKIFDRLSGSVDFYSKNTKDLLFKMPLASSQGLPSFQWRNLMEMNNKGVEIELTYDIVKSNDLQWDFSVNATHVSSEITKLPELYKNGYETGDFKWVKGKDIYNYYLKKFAGVDPANGDALYYVDVKQADGSIKVEKTNSINAATRYQLNKSPIPDLMGGFSTSARYKGFDFSFSAAYEIGGWAIDSDYAGMMSPGGRNNWHTDIYKRWTPDNTNTNVPRLEEGNLSLGGGNSDRFLTRRTHLSIKNITLGYTFPKTTLSNLGVEKIRVFAVGDNLALISERKGFDPRQSFSGETGGIYGMIRTVSFGFNINF